MEPGIWFVLEIDLVNSDLMFDCCAVLPMFTEINIEYGGGESGACIGRRGGGDRFCQLRLQAPKVETPTSSS